MAVAVAVAAVGGTGGGTGGERKATVEEEESPHSNCTSTTGHGSFLETEIKPEGVREGATLADKDELGSECCTGERAPSLRQQAMMVRTILSRRFTTLWSRTFSCRRRDAEYINKL